MRDPLPVFGSSHNFVIPYTTTRKDCRFQTEWMAVIAVHVPCSERAQPDDPKGSLLWRSWRWRT